MPEALRVTYAAPKGIEPVSRTVGRNIRRLRNQQELSQQKLGSRCGLQQRAIKRIEDSEGNPLLCTVYRIACGLGVSLNRLVYDGSREMA